MILYSAIAKSFDGTILAEATTAGVEGNHPIVAQQLIQALVKKPKLLSIGNRKTFAHIADGDANDNYWGLDESNEHDYLETYFHAQRAENVYFLCLSDDRDANKQRA